MTGNVFYAVLRAALCWWARWYLRLEVIGRDHLPRTGGVLVAGNHVSYLDIPMLGCALERPADFMGKIELFRNPIAGWVYRRLGGFPIRRGGMTKEALSEATRRLKAGHVVVIYPEGKINASGELLPPKLGIGLVVARAGVPVLPVYVVGTDDAMPRNSWWIRPRPVTVLIGKPLTFAAREMAQAEGAGGSADMRAWHEEISLGVMRAIVALCQQSAERNMNQKNVENTTRS